MTENVNAGTEKIFFHWILSHPNQFYKVDVSFFNNEKIQFIYNIIKEDFIISKDKKIPSLNQIVAMVKMKDSDNQINKQLIQELFKYNKNAYEDDWIKKNFSAWKISNQTKNNVFKSVKFIRGIKTLDYDNVIEVATKIRNIFNETKLIEDNDDELVDDFDDPDAHIITERTKAIPTGWKTLDNVLEGGWSQQTLSVFIGQTSVGKSMWMQNCTVNVANQGGNVLFITLEMSSQKCMKRMGAMRLQIPINSYNEKSKDKIFMKNKINSLKKLQGGLFSTKPGKIFVRKFDTATLTITELDNFISEVEEKKKIKINLVVVDYISLMTIEKGLDFANMLFLKGKHLAEGLRYIADKHKTSVITATQTDKAVWDANDLELKNIPESKAIAETADSVFGIIRNPEMKKNNIYRLKNLKLRDGEQTGAQIKFDFDPTYLKIENDEFYGVV